ncbi:PD40 domain-containing protein [candidate division WOR-3 bacterium]|nr:PD40 domain-containing protein [candidate division WOR-3 bacterium]
MNTEVRSWILALLVVVLLVAACEEPLYLVPRGDAIPPGAVKMTPALDTWPPILHSDEWEQPVPMPGPVNTAGAEDSPFITPDGEWFFFFFTPDVGKPANEQLFDGATGIYWSRRQGSGWTEPERVVLNDDIGLDGAEFVLGDTLWFASVRSRDALREGPEWYKAVLRGDEWRDWRNAGSQLNLDYEVGELHISADGRTMFCHREAAAGGAGGMDLWSLARNATGWDPPVNLGTTVNGPGDEGWPFLSADGSELWFTANGALAGPGPALWRCRKDSTGAWGEPEEIVSRFAGECTMDEAGNLYFVHHFFTGTDPIQMIEADIYVCFRK